MKSYDVTIWPIDDRAPYTARYESPTSIDALVRALGAVREAGVSVAHVRLVTLEEQAAERKSKP